MPTYSSSASKMAALTTAPVSPWPTDRHRAPAPAHQAHLPLDRRHRDRGVCFLPGGRRCQVVRLSITTRSRAPSPPEAPSRSSRCWASMCAAHPSPATPFEDSNTSSISAPFRTFGCSSAPFELPRCSIGTGRPVQLPRSNRHFPRITQVFGPVFDCSNRCWSDRGAEYAFRCRQRGVIG